MIDVKTKLGFSNALKIAFIVAEILLLLRVSAVTSGSMGNGKGSVPTMLSVVLFSSLLTVRN